jgi:hypothetical protein
MAKAALAEWLLSLALPRDRSAAAIGDWLESTGERGNLWFWSCVFRTLIAQVWSDLTDSPVHILLLTLRSYLFVFSLLAAIALVLLPFMTLFAAWHLLPPPKAHGTFEILAANWDGWASASYGSVTGWWLARQGKEMAVCVMSCLLPAVLLSLSALTIPWFAGSSLCAFIGTQLIFFNLGLFVGSLGLRRQPAEGTLQ